MIQYGVVCPITTFFVVTRVFYDGVVSNVNTGRMKMQISKEKVLEYLKTVTVTQWFYVALSFFVFVNDLFLFMDFDGMVYWNTEAVLGIFSFYVITLFLYTPIALGIIAHTIKQVSKNPDLPIEKMFIISLKATPHTITLFGIFVYIWYVSRPLLSIFN